MTMTTTQSATRGEPANVAVWAAICAARDGDTAALSILCGCVGLGCRLTRDEPNPDAELWVLHHVQQLDQDAQASIMSMGVPLAVTKDGANIIAQRFKDRFIPAVAAMHATAYGVGDAPATPPADPAPDACPPRTAAVHAEMLDALEKMEKLPAERQVELYRLHASHLYRILDDLETALDLAHGDDGWYVDYAERAIRRRFDTALTDGYSLVFKAEPHPMINTERWADEYDVDDKGEPED